MRKIIFLMAGFGLMMMACNSNNSNPPSVEENTKDSAHIQPQVEVKATVFQDSGLVKVVDDIGFPLFYVELEPGSGQRPNTFILNIDEAQIEHDAAWHLPGKTIRFSYTVTEEPFLMDMLMKGQTLLGQYAPKHDSTWKEITGTLGDATEETPGDLPSHITITDTKNSTIRFEYFVTQEFVEANNKTVSAYYEYRNVYKISSLTTEFKSGS